jgi:hypothetical protein
MFADSCPCIASTLCCSEKDTVPFIHSIIPGMDMKELFIFSLSQIRGPTTLAFGFLLANNQFFSQYDKDIVLPINSLFSIYPVSLS